jgi:16S rRNA C1402 N4-methylase RsmH
VRSISERSFSFQSTARWMRMTPTTGSTADLISHLPEGGRRFTAIAKAKPPVRAIVSQAIRRTVGWPGNFHSAGYSRQSKIHPATRTFQALRIAVNDGWAP